MLGQNIVPDGVGNIGRSTGGQWYPVVPLSSVKFEPYWTQLDANLLKVFNIGSWRYDTRFSFYNVLNNSVVLDHGGSRNGYGSTGADYQALTNWETRQPDAGGPRHPVRDHRALLVWSSPPASAGGQSCLRPGGMSRRLLI